MTPNPTQPVSTDVLLEESRWLRGVARALVGSDDQAEDLAQDVLAEALRSRPRVAADRVRGWLRVVARRKASRSRRRDRARSDSEWMASRTESVHAADEPDSHDRLVLHRELAEAIDALEPGERDLIVWRYFDGRDAVWIAGRLGMSHAAARQRLTRALARLRTRLAASKRGPGGWSLALIGLSRLPEGITFFPLPSDGPGAPGSTVAPAQAAGAVGPGPLTGGSSALFSMSITKLVAVAALAILVALYHVSTTGRGIEAESAVVERRTQSNPGAADLARATSSERRTPEATPAAGTHPTAPEPADGLILTIQGRVIDDQRIPVAGVRVRLFTDSGPPTLAVTNEIGRYSIRGPERLHHGRHSGYLSAHASDGRAAVAYQHIPSDVLGAPLAAPDLVLGNGRSVAVRVTEDGAPVEGAEVTLDVGFARLVAGQGSTDQAGYARFEGIPAGSLRAIARRGERIGAARATSMEGIETLAVELERARTIVVEVRGSGREVAPIPGARVIAMERLMPSMTSWDDDDPFGFVQRTRPVRHAEAVTGADGKATIAGLPPWALRIDVSHDRSVTNSTISRRADVSDALVTIEMDLIRPRDKVSWPIVRSTDVDAIQAPADGTELMIRPRPGAYYGAPPKPWPALAIVEDGQIVLRGVPATFTAAIARSPSGTVAEMWLSEEESDGWPVTFRAPRTITVKVTERDGTPAPERRVQVFNQGNNGMGEPVPSDASGVARIEGLIGGLVDVRVLEETAPRGGWNVGSVDLAKGDADLEFVLPERFDALLLVSVDGARRLPTHLLVRGARVISEDAASAAVRIEVTLQPASDVAEITMRSYREVLGATVALTRSDLVSEAPIEVDLRSAGNILVAVLAPDGTKVKLVAEPLATDGGGAHAIKFALDSPNADDGLYLLGPLPAGTYRVRDLKSGTSTGPFDVDPTLGPTRVTLDLSRHGVVRGLVRGPEGTELWRSRVVVSGEGVTLEDRSRRRRPGMPRNSVQVAFDGSFEVPTTVGQELSLSVWHPVLSGRGTLGEARIQGPLDGVELTLVERTAASFTLPKPQRERSEYPQRVLLLNPSIGADAHASEIANAVRAEHALALETGTAVARFGGFAPGRYSIWIDVGNEVAPIVIPDVELGEGVTDLGAPAFGKGSSIRFKLNLADGANAPRVVPIARAAAQLPSGDPLYGRNASSNGETEVVLSGLGKGTFALQCMLFDMTFPLDGVTVELDGVTDEVIEVDL